MASALQKYLRSEYSHSVHGAVSSLLAVVSSPTHQHTQHAVPGPSLGTIPNTNPNPNNRSKLNCPLQTTLAMQCNKAVAGCHALPGLPSPRPTRELRLWSSRSTRPSFTEAYPGATVVRDCLLRSAPFVASAVCLALIAPSILRCRGTPRPVALGPTPLPQGTTSKGGDRCPGEPRARSHSGPMHIGEDVQEPTPLPTSHAPCPDQASALLHPHYCRHPRRCGLQRLGCDVQVLQQELLSLCYDEQTSALPRASTCLGGKSRSRTPRKYRWGGGGH